MVSNAREKAVIEGFGEVKRNLDYKLTTVQHVVQSATQTQGYITISVDAEVHSLRLGE